MTYSSTLICTYTLKYVSWNFELKTIWSQDSLFFSLN